MRFTSSKIPKDKLPVKFVQRRVKRKYPIEEDEEDAEARMLNFMRRKADNLRSKRGRSKMVETPRFIGPFYRPYENIAKNIFEAGRGEADDDLSLKDIFQIHDVSKRVYNLPVPEVEVFEGHASDAWRIKRRLRMKKLFDMMKMKTFGP